MIHLERESWDGVAPDKLFLSVGWQQDLHDALALVEREIVETGTGHNEEEHICKVSTCKYEQFT
jgi:hypothetical protein